MDPRYLRRVVHHRAHSTLHRGRTDQVFQDAKELVSDCYPCGYDYRCCC